MFLRKFSTDKDGKRLDYWALVESVRTERGPRQRIVSYLGDMDEAGRLGIHHAVEKDLPVQESLFDKTSPEWVEVNVRRVESRRIAETFQYVSCFPSKIPYVGFSPVRLQTRYPITTFIEQSYL